MTSHSCTPTSNQHDPLSPPPSPFSEPDLPIIATDDLGMIADDEQPLEKTKSSAAPAVDSEEKNKTQPGRRRRQVTYVSRHFATQEKRDGPRSQSKRSRARGVRSQSAPGNVAAPISGVATPPVTPVKAEQPQTRVVYGFNIDDLSSDSSLTDVPEDIGPDPFSPTPSSSPSNVRAIKRQVKRTGQSTKSPYFPHPHKHRPTFLSTLPFPPLSHETFGLMQERLAHDPFRLLIATIFLNKTPGERAMPIFYQLITRYPTPAQLASAQVSDIVSLIYKLGFQNQRARKCVEMAKAWIQRPPEHGKRYRKLGYPKKGDGRDVKSDETIGDDDPRIAWEISHLPGLGPYSHDSWRMFCRDKLRRLSTSWNGEDAKDQPGFEPEWKRVVPLDKELRAYLTWVWMKEGWVWNKETGQRTKASERLMAQARGGGVVVEERDSNHLIIQTINGDNFDGLEANNKVERTAGDFLPRDDDNGRRCA